MTDMDNRMKAKFQRLQHLIGATILITLLGTTGPAACGSGSQVYSAADDFSASLNPSGAWSYGWSTSLGGALVLYDDRGLAFSSPFEYWRRSGQGYPVMFHNPHLENITNDNLFLPAGGLDLHPSNNGEFAIIRWTVLAAGVASIATVFSGNDTVAPTSDVHVLQNGVSMFDGAISSFGQTLPFSKSVVVAAGDTVDFAVGWGANHNYRGDNTGVSATINFTPLLLSIRVSAVDLCWDSVTNASYQPQYRSDLTTNNWAPLSAGWTQGDGTRTCVTDEVSAGQPQRFYRVAITNSPAVGQ